ncbi:MAG: hypothetical protein J4F98_12965 [Acidobacteria bacterium]|nr:hypothetical protein [Acidobacteriota bacterium]
MAVYDHGYRGYGGALMPARSRFLVISRYGLRDVFASRLFLAFFAFCFAWPLVLLVAMYLRYNAEALALINVSASDLLDFVQVNTWFFQNLFLHAQLYLAFVVVLVVGPSLVSADLRNRAMPLYLSRPLTRTDYVLGKLVVLGVLVSAITWVPGLLLFAIQAALGGGEWLAEHWRVAPSLVVVSTVWMLCMSLPMLAIAAWVKWKPWARIVFLGAILSGTAFGEFYKQFYDSWLGSMVVAFDVTAALSSSVFGTEVSIQMPGAAAWLAAVGLVALSAALLYRRVRAFEVVK